MTYAEICEKLLKEIINLVRGDIDDLLRCTLKALIVLDVHCRDVISELSQKNITSKDDFS